MPPVAAITPWNNGALFGKGGKTNTPAVDYPLAIVALLAPLCVCSIKDPGGDVGLKGHDAQLDQTFGRRSVDIEK